MAEGDGEVTIREINQIQTELKGVRKDLTQHLIDEGVHQGKQEAHWEAVDQRFDQVLSGIDKVIARQDKTNGNVRKNAEDIDGLQTADAVREGRSNLKAAVIAGAITLVGFIGTLTAITFQVKSLLAATPVGG